MATNRTTATTTLAEANHGEAITTALAAHPTGTTARTLATDTGVSLATVNSVLATLETAGTVTRTPGARKGTELWSLTAADPTDTAPDDTGTDGAAVDAPDADTTSTTDDASDSTEADAPETDADAETTDEDGTPEDTSTAEDVSDSAQATAPVSGAPVSGAPTGRPDLRIIMVAGVLGDHPGGVSAADIGTQSGLRSQIVARALAAMHAADAARRITSDADPTVELWVRGDTDPATVDMTNVTGYTECPTCGHKSRIRTAGPLRHNGATVAGMNADGQPKLGKGELRTMVLDFINTHPGHEFTDGVLGRELGRSSGAVRNSMNTLLAQGLIQPLDTDGRKVTALATAGR